MVVSSLCTKIDSDNENYVGWDLQWLLLNKNLNNCRSHQLTSLGKNNQVLSFVSKNSIRAFFVNNKKMFCTLHGYSITITAISEIRR